MFIVRWAAGFIVQPWSKKEIKVERYLRLPSDKKTDPEKVITSKDLQDIVQKHRDSDKSR